MKLTERQKKELEEIYTILQQQYKDIAEQISLTCEGCSDNCCDSYFKHHTYVEWLYFREGLSRLTDEERGELEEKAKSYLIGVAQAESRGERPLVMCPVNKDGLCTLYQYRFLVCRTHGVPAKMKYPGGKIDHFPGCFRCQENVEIKYGERGREFVPTVNRTPMLIRLAKLEKSIFDGKRDIVPKVDKTIAEMILLSPKEFLEKGE